MADTENKKPVRFDKLDGGLVTLYPAWQIQQNQSPDAKNFDVSVYGQFKTRAGYAKFTPSAKGSPTGTGINGLIAAAQSASGADKVWQVQVAGPTYVDLTTAFNSAGSATLFPSPSTNGDYCAIGLLYTFSTLTLNLTTPGIGGTVAIEYWNGSSWVALSGVTDNTTGLTASGVHTVSWAIPSDWAKSAINSSKSLYFMRFRTTGTYSTRPIVGASTLSPGRIFVLAAEGSTLQDITDGTWATPITGLTISLNTRVHLMMYNNKFLIGNQGGGPWKCSDGIAASTLGGSPPAAAVGGMVHRSRVWWFPANSSTATFSGLNAEEDYTSSDNAGSVVINNGDGMVLNAMASGGLFAVISKISPTSGGTEGKMYILQGSSTFDFSVQKIADICAQGPDALLSYDNLVIAATNRGIYAFQSQIPTKLSQNIKPTYDTIVGQAGLAMGKLKTTLRLSYASAGGNNDSQLIFDIERGVWGLNQTKPFSRYASHPNGTLLAGHVSQALVYTEDSGTSDDGGAINAYWITQASDWGMFASPKAGQAVDIHAENTGNWPLTLTYLLDTVDTGYSDTMNPSTEGPVKRMLRLPNKRGKRHQLKVTANAISQPVSVNGLILWGEIFNPGTK